MRMVHLGGKAWADLDAVVDFAVGPAADGTTSLTLSFPQGTPEEINDSEMIEENLSALGQSRDELAPRPPGAPHTRLPRMTTRRWIVAVTVVGLLLALAQLGKRWLSYGRRAAYHDAVIRDRAKPIDGRRIVVRLLTRSGIDHHTAMRRRYEQAARYPRAYASAWGVWG
jgi:hypothetical protein